ncbi:MAG: ABC transporter permease [Anaerolineales bacterium]
MATETNTMFTISSAKRKAWTSTLSRVLKYTLLRGVTMFITVVIGIYLTILIANMGGYVDEIMRGSIRESIGMRLRNDDNYKELSPDAQKNLFASEVAVEEKRLGLDQPFIIRSFRFLWNGLTLNLGRALNMTSDTGSKEVRLIILERLGPTLLMMGTSQLLLFFISIYLALILSRKYGSFVDRLVIALSPSSSAPGWFYGIFLILIFAAVLQILPFGGMIGTPPPENSWEYALDVLKHLILPVSALIIAAIFVSIYNWRTFFLIFSSEDYVEMAKAKGLPSREIERRYILRPTLPTIITSFSLSLLYLLSGAPIIETIFIWPGLGRALYTAVGLYDTPVIVASTIIFAYLLAITVFLLDFVYALVDPRVKVGGGTKKV